MYVEGLFLEGAGWDAAAQQLTESQPGALFALAPLLWLRPRLVEQFRAYPHYNCPLYRTPDRRGVLATTGHSTNFVCCVRLPSARPAAHWIMRGVALLTQLAD
jgi:dynein heavy chain